MLERLAEINPWLPTITMLALLVIVALLVDWIANRGLVAVVKRFVTRTSVSWDNTIVEHKVVDRLVHLLPAIIIFTGIPFVPSLPDGVTVVIRNVAVGYMALMLTMALSSLLSAASAIYAETPMARDRPLKGFIQLMQIAVWIFGGVMVIAAVLNKSPLLLLSGFGAMTAILLLVFRDTILSLVASVQLTAQDMVRVGDWIEMPQFGADGDVIDVQLHTVKVQNWDKTITTIPTHRLITDSFKNWRGMSQAGGRRIKRAVHLDVSSIRFMTPEEIERFRRFVLLEDYIDRKEKELADYNKGLARQVDADVNQRRLTNIGTFRAYAFNYLKHHPNIRQDMTLLVRQREPGPQGLPLEIYCFTKTTAWADYENIQSDIFDHLLAIVPEFGLRVYQQPAGSDLASLSVSAQTRPLGDTT
jgi:miniconductance mechanosensitive channel